MNKAGTYKNNLSGESAYKSYCPNHLPPHPELIMDKEMIDLLVKVNKEVALLENISKGIPNIDLFISMYVRKEALMSSQIEGTQATLEDILDPSIDENVNVNVKDVVNYIKAINYSIERLKELPLCNRLIKETHAVLMEGVRGQDKSPGDFRHSQNWLGGSGSTLKTARYIPPNVKDMLDAISELEKYMNTEDDTLDVFIKAALIHYQFETIHPFLDGNGRIGRLLIQLYLIQHKVLSTPALYLSYFLKKYRIEYYDRLTEVRRTGDFEQWVKFFLRALYESAENANLTIRQLVFLHTINVETLSKIGRRSTTALILFNYLEKNPIIELSKASNDLGLTFATVSKIVDIMINNGILIQYSGVKRNRTFAYDAYLQLLREGTE